jgi:nucleotidyltransferase/DNA polymerase involved in DNA repair
MLCGYGHREINRARTIEELWELMDNEISRFFEQYEQHKQFDRRFIGESKVKDKQYQKEKSLSYSSSQNKTSTTANKPVANNNYKKVDNVNTTYPPRKRYSNIGEVIVEDTDIQV